MLDLGLPEFLEVMECGGKTGSFGADRPAFPVDSSVFLFVTHVASLSSLTTPGSPACLAGDRALRDPA